MEPQKTILLVEDEPLIAVAEKLLLEKHGYQVATAATGEQAVELALDRDGKFDLVLMDINLGNGIDGTEAAAAILAQREIPIVFLSSHTDPAVVDRTEKITSYGYIVKNCGETVMLAAIRMAFRLNQEKRRVQEREHLFRGVLNTIQDGISVLDRDLNIQHVNEVMNYWYPETGSLIGRRCHEVYQSRQDPCSMCPSLRAMKSGRTERQEMPGRENSPVEWLELFAYPMRDPVTGEISGVVEFVRDITERRRLETALEERKTLVDRFFSQSLQGLFTCMLDEPVEWNENVDKEAVLEYILRHQRMTRVNQALLDQYGAEETDFIGITLEQLFAHDREQIRQLVREINDRGRMRLETRELRLDGTPVIFNGEYVCMYDEQGRITGHFGAQVDITEEKKRETEREEERLLLSSILDAAPVGIWLVDRDQNPLLVNQEFRKNTGVGEGPVSMTPEELAMCKETDEKTLETGVPQRFEETITYKDGSRHTLQTIKTRLMKRDGSVRGILGIGVDITNYRSLLAEKELLLRETHHRVKNSFATVESLLRIQSDYYPEAKNALTDARGQIANYRVLYEKLLRTEDYHTVSAGSYLEEIASSVLDAHGAAEHIRYEGAVQEMELPAKTALALGTIVVELVTNVTKHAYRPGEPGTVRLEFSRYGERGILHVEDDGAGLPEGVALSSIESFGLLVTRMTAVQLGGTFTVESSRGNGTRCSVDFQLRSGDV